MVSFIKMGTAAAVASPIVQMTAEAVIPPVWGIPISTVMAALAGAGLSLFFGDPVESRRSLWGQMVAAAVFGIAIATLAADATGWRWAQHNRPMFVLMTAAVVRWFLPSAIERGKEVIRHFKFSFMRRAPAAPTAPEPGPESDPPSAADGGDRNAP